MEYILYVLLIMSVLMEATKTLLLTKFEKTSLKTDADIYQFNAMMYGGCLAVVLCTLDYRISLFTAVTALLFSAVTVASQVFFLKALKYGPLSVTTFMQGNGLIIPVLYGVVFMREKLTLLQIVAFPVLFVALAMVLNVGREKLPLKWWLQAGMSLITMGLVGVAQTFHQSSAHAEELNGFLILAFLYAITFNLLLRRLSMKQETKTFPLNRYSWLMAGVSGVFMGIVNIVNLYLSGVMPKAIVFPVLNGGLIVATIIGSVIFFRERLNWKQWTGVVLCVAAMCALGM